MDQRFRWDERLHLKRDFTRVYKEGRRYQKSGLILWAWRPPQDGDVKSRLGLAISKTYGNAVTRNRLKRLIREAFRLNKHRLTGAVDMVFSATPMGRDIRLRTIEPIVLTLWMQAKLLPPSREA